MEFKALRCLLSRENGSVCNAYLGDVEAGRQVTLRFTCRNHPPGLNRIEFAQNDAGVVSWQALPADEDKSYCDDGARINHGSN